MAFVSNYLWLKNSSYTPPLYHGSAQHSCKTLNSTTTSPFSSSLSSLLAPSRSFRQFNINPNLYRKNNLKVLPLRVTPSASATATEITTTNATSKWTVFKFGGSSVGNAQRIKDVANLIVQEMGSTNGKILAVVSAVKGVTDLLQEMINSAQSHGPNHHYMEGIVRLREIHEAIATEIIPNDDLRAAFMVSLNSNLDDIKDVLRASWIARSASNRIRELIMGYGELWSAQLLWHRLRSQKSKSHSFNCSWLDARDVLFTRPPEDESVVASRKFIDWSKSNEMLSQWIITNKSTDIIIATGFIATDHEGVPTTLGRNGSDYSASIFAKMLQAKECQIWTDVDGVYSADPRLVKDAFPIPIMSYQEVAELAYFGAKVVHPDTMIPVIDEKIPVRIRNTFNPQAFGTLICEKDNAVGFTVDLISGSKKYHEKILGSRREALGVKGFSSISSVTLVNVEGTGMIGVPGIASRLFQALYKAGISCILIAQASSEYSICAAVLGSEGTRARAVVERAFRSELTEKVISSVSLIANCSILAMVGENMDHQTGVASRFFSALAKKGVNIRAMAQGSSEHNISVVIDGKDELRALQASHSAFYLSDQAISVGIVGPGVVGGAFIQQILNQAQKLRDEFGVDLQVTGIATSKKMIFGFPNIDLNTWKEDFETRAIPCNLDEFAKHIKDNTYLPHSVICDCTASPVTSDLYEKWLSMGINIVTPNKKANSSSYKYYQALREAQTKYKTHFFYEANVGAGLPIISTIRDLFRTGDSFIEIQGIFSGTLSYIFNEFNGTVPFSEIVKKAKELGYTEPDPREDLSGMDVARKVVILAREVGLSVELEDVPVKSLVPAPLAPSDVSVEEFMSKLANYDEEIGSQAKKASDAGQKLRYVGVVDVKNKKCAVELRHYDKSHPFGGLKGSDNIISFRTSRYDSNPLVVQGPGAGADVTAAGVFADLLRLAAYLGAPSAADVI